jgi:hypothetical protein
MAEIAIPENRPRIHVCSRLDNVPCMASAVMLFFKKAPRATETQADAAGRGRWMVW